MRRRVTRHRRTPWLLPTLSAAALLACNDTKLDQDGDGFTELTGDCDDLDANVHPDAQEVCYNGIDDNCNGEEDEEGATSGRVWYVDLDGDNFGNETVTMEACTQPPHYAPNKWDCDEDSAAVNPNADEICDYIDNDCDGEVDEATSLDARSWFPDRDGDGYGNDDTMVVSCTAPVGYIDTGGDCGDLDPLQNPDATEDCRTEADDDCDGTPNGEDAYGCTDFYADLDGDGYAGSAACLCAPDGVYTSTIQEDCDDERAEVYPGAPSSRRWQPEDCSLDLAVDLADPEQDLTTDWMRDASSITLRTDDFNGDGQLDLLVGGTYAQTRIATAPFDRAALEGEASLIPSESTGWSTALVASVPDQDGDGRPDLATLVAPWSSVTGGTYLFSSSATATPSWDDALAWDPIYPFNGTARFMDLDEDGLVEMLHSTDGVYASVRTINPDVSADPIEWNTEALAIDGYSYSVPRYHHADLDGDGVRELLVGRKPNDTTNRVGEPHTTYWGAVSTYAVESDHTLRLKHTVHGWSELGRLGFDVADWNGDGHADLLAVEASSLMAPSSGQLLVFEGPVYEAGLYDAVDTLFTADARVSGTEDDDLGEVHSLGDVDGDGRDELLLRGTAEDSVWLLLYEATGHSSITDLGRPFDPEPGMATTGLSVGDLSADGIDDIILQVESSSTTPTRSVLFLHGDTQP